MKLHTLLKAMPFTALPAENPDITDIANNHESVRPGSLFVCIQGFTFDGHAFAAAAAEKGAAAIVAEKEVEASVPVIRVKDTKRALAVLSDWFCGQPTHDLKLIGITGTNGKTTVSHLIEKICRDAGSRTGLIGTMYMKIGDQKIETKNTTPDVLTLQKTFKEMKDSGVDTAVMEVSSHALVQGRVLGCDYDVAVFTNLTQDHLDYHKTMEEYRHAKSLLFSRLGNTYDSRRPKAAVLNADDEASGLIASETAAPIITYGIDKKADFAAKSIRMDGSGTLFILESPFGLHEVSLQLMGRFSVYNALAALAAATAAGVPIIDAIRSVESVEGVAGRFEAVKGGQEFPVIVDYAHTPDSLENVLKTVRQIAAKRIFAVVGCGGDRDKTKRPLMAQIACQYATDPIFTSDNPRSEDPIAILADMEAGVQGNSYEVIPDRREAIRAAVARATAGDVVLIAGKGHETYQIIGDVVHDFDDRKVALEAIKER